LEANGCKLIRDAGKHSVYLNPTFNRTSSIPRHREIKNPTAKAICKQLSVPDPIR
jgi:mRNA interferase HicA